MANKLNKAEKFVIRMINECDPERDPAREAYDKVREKLKLESDYCDVPDKHMPKEYLDALEKYASAIAWMGPDIVPFNKFLKGSAK